MKYEEIIKKIENIIPPIPELQKNFLKNIQHGFKIEYMCCENIQTEIYEYDYNTNTVIINLYLINSLSKNQEEINNLINYALLCGLLQMSSTYSKRQIPKTCGFGSIYKKVHTERLEYIKLTKGYTELLASEIEQRNLEENSNNTIIMILKQLELIVGRNTMLEIYFGNEKNKLEQKLKKIYPELPVKEFLELIETIEQNEEEKENKIEYIQNMLKTLFEQKLRQIKTQQQKELELIKTKLEKSITAATINFDKKIPYLYDFQEALKNSKKIEEQQKNNDEIIKKMQEDFSKWIIRKNKTKGKINEQKC